MARIENWNPPQIVNKTGIYSWDVGHASIAHEGGETEDGGYILPRPWTDRAVGETDLELEFKAAWDETQSLDESFESIANVLFGEFHIAMADPVWNWLRATQRKSGEFVPAGQRNIIDFSDLYNSQFLEFSTEEVS